MEALRNYLSHPGRTLLCVGPVSLNVVRAAVELSRKRSVPMVFIASRRQVEAAQFGGGYANSWTTESFLRFLSEIKSSDIYAARDHGGPGQGSVEKQGPQTAEHYMKVAAQSYLADLEAGMDIFHLDPSIPLPGEHYSFETVMARIEEFYGLLCEQAAKKGRKIAFEIGTEEHSGLAPNVEVLRELLQRLTAFCAKNSFPRPLFVVAQTGTRVEELRNVGVFEESSSAARAGTLALVQQAAALIQTHGSFLKEHNADYLSTQNLALRPHLGIRAANVAPEFGAVETKGFLHLMHLLRCTNEIDEYQQYVMASQSWKKWLSPNSKATDTDKVIMAGHYCWAQPTVVDIKKRVASQASRKGLDLDGYLRQNIMASMLRFLAAFGQTETP